MSDQQQELESKQYPVKQSAMFAGGAATTMALVDLVAHMGPTGLLLSGIAGLVAWRHGPEIYETIEQQVREFIPSLPHLADQDNQGEPGEYKRTIWDRALGRYPTQDDQGNQGNQDDQAQPSKKLDPLFQIAAKQDDNGITRLTIEQIIKNTTPNSYRVWIGRSLTDPEHRAVQINFYKQHFRFMGASQRGKSSMIAAFLEIVTRTHDPKHVRIALLDMEDQTSNLFAHLPHVATIRRGNERIRLHARNADDVLERLINVVEIMQYRYEGLTKEQLLQQPILLCYIEEFLALKNEFKSRVDRAKSKSQAEREKAQSDYATLVYCIEALAQRGLKARVQLLLGAQVEYADDDFKEALVNVQCGFAFCVRPTAAASAGFQNGELIRKNAKANKVGQAVVETPDCNDLVLAPEYDLEQRILDFERLHHIQREQAAPEGHSNELEDVEAIRPARQPEPVEAGQRAIEPAAPKMEPLEPNQRKLTNLHRQALEHYQPGLGYRQIGELIGVGKDKAGELIKDLRRWGFIKDDAGNE